MSVRRASPKMARKGGPHSGTPGPASSRHRSQWRSRPRLARNLVPGRHRPEPMPGLLRRLGSVPARRSHREDPHHPPQKVGVFTATKPQPSCGKRKFRPTGGALDGCGGRAGTAELLTGIASSGRVTRFPRIRCDRCGKDRMISETHFDRRDMRHRRHQRNARHVSDQGRT